MSNEIKVGFGLADITIDDKDMGLQGDGAVFTAEPMYLEVETYEMGIYDLYLDTWNVNLSVTFQDESFEKLKMALPAMDELKANGEVVGLTDGAMHQRMRDKAVEIVVHPRDAGSNKSSDITIYKAYPVGIFERGYGKEVVAYTVEFKALPVTGNASAGNNFFLIGEDGESATGEED